MITLSQILPFSAKLVFLDSHPLSLLADPRLTSDAIAITKWAASLVAAGHRVYIPEVIDYEFRRELIRAGRTASLRELDVQKTRYWYVPITTDTMLLAADLWQNITP